MVFQANLDNLRRRIQEYMVEMNNLQTSHERYLWLEKTLRRLNREVSRMVQRESKESK